MSIAIQEIIKNIKNRSLEELKRDYARSHGLSDVPTNLQLISLYHQMVKDGEIAPDQEILDRLKKRAVRSKSGIVPIQVLTKPFWCPGKCIFCPTDITMPKSYINTEPGAMRALLNQFDPYKQVYNRLLSLRMTGHATDKIEMIVLGGTWDVYPKAYKTEFIKGLYDACNTFDEFLQSVEIDSSNPRAARFSTPTYQLTYPETIEESILINETASCRIIGLTVETRPEYVTNEACAYRRSLGVTRLEIGVQSLFDPVLDANKRGHSVQQIRDAFHLLRTWGFKFAAHFMSGLYQSNMEMDIETFDRAFADPAIRPDEIKFYPTGVIPNTELYELHKKGEYVIPPLEQTKQVIKKVILDLPAYTRVKRLIRDIPASEVVGTYVTNLRQLVEDELKKEMKGLEAAQYKKLYPGLHIVSEQTLLNKISLDEKTWVTFTPDFHSEREFLSLCTRSREVKHKRNETSGGGFVIRGYRSSAGHEMFISVEDTLGYLYGFARLLLPVETAPDPALTGNALIRELHVYGQLASLSETGEVQHKGRGTKLMNLAEDIAQKFGYAGIAVISGVGVRGFYEKIGYHKKTTYMVKTFSA